MAQFACPVADLFCHLAMGRRKNFLARFDAPLGEREFVAIDPGCVLAHQQHIAVFQQGHYQDSARRGAEKPLIMGNNAIGKTQFQLFDVEQACLGQSMAFDDLRLVSHPGNRARCLPANGTMIP